MLTRRKVDYSWCPNCSSVTYEGGYYCRSCGAITCARHHVADYEMCRVCADMRAQEEREWMEGR